MWQFIFSHILTSFWDYETDVFVSTWSTIVSCSSNRHFCNCFWSTFSKSDHWLSPSVNYFSINFLIVFWVPCLFLIGFKEELAYGGDKNKTFSVRCIAKLSYYVSCFLIFHCTTIGLGRGCYMNIHTHMYIYISKYLYHLCVYVYLYLYTNIYTLIIPA